MMMLTMRFLELQTHTVAWNTPIFIIDFFYLHMYVCDSFRFVYNPS